MWQITGMEVKIYVANRQECLKRFVVTISIVFPPPNIL